MDLLAAKDEFSKLMTRLNSQEKQDFVHWVENVFGKSDCQSSKASTKDNTDVILENIKDDIRQTVPLDAIAPGENITFSNIQTECDPLTTVHVDGFLYDDDAIDTLCDEGRLSRNYCLSCGSEDIKPFTFLSHSATAEQVKFIIQNVLPDLTGKTVVDVGSRLGPFIYGSSLYSSASKIYGIEINEYFCNIQQKILEKYHMTDRVMVVCDDIRNQAQLLQTADVIILHNVFEFFMDPDAQKSIWLFLYNILRKENSLIVTMPSLEDSLKSLQVDLNIEGWVKHIPIADQVNLVAGKNSDDQEMLDSVHLYQVL